MIFAAASVACRDRPAATRSIAGHDDSTATSAAAPDAPPDAAAPEMAAPPLRVATPSAPWLAGRGPSCAGYVSVSTVDLVSCAVCRDGAVHCWGDTSSRVLARGATRGASDVTRIDGISDAAAVAASFAVACVIDRAGRVRCWGNRGSAASDAAHDAGPQPKVSAIVDIPLPATAVAVEVGDLHACALLATADVACWGRNDWGQVGVDDPGSGPGGTVAPVVIPRLRAIRIAVAANVSCAVDTEHRAWCWGWNGSGAAGTGDRRHRIGLVRIGTYEDVIDIATDGRQGCLRRANHEVRCWGQPDQLIQASPAPAVRARFSAGRALAVDGDTVSSVGDDGTITVATGAAPPRPLPGLPPVLALSTGGGGACAILHTGELRCWGTNHRAELVLGLSPGSR
ncbi:MAG TPA: RCC1 domain-containing protein [Kofleriaceae bacterium]|nr:RCC1 domain-containing protein [Kofleriaceae bacterium]